MFLVHDASLSDFAVVIILTPPTRESNDFGASAMQDLPIRKKTSLVQRVQSSSR
jgi:hypothetical protein